MVGISNSAMKLTSTFAAQGILRLPCSLSMLAAYCHVVRATCRGLQRGERMSRTSAYAHARRCVGDAEACSGRPVRVHETFVSVYPEILVRRARRYLTTKEDRKGTRPCERSSRYR